jgi:AraC-like DNA-binding protein
MEQIRFLAPAPPLRSFVRCYAQREAVIGNAILSQAVPARAAPILEFLLGDIFEVHWCNRTVIETPARAVLVGLQTHRRVRLKATGVLESFCVIFQPGGLHALFDIPMQELTDHDYDAHAVLGRWVSCLLQRLGECHAFEERADIASEVLLRHSEAIPSLDGVSAAANAILRSHDPISMPDLAAKAGLGVRQFQRRYLDQIGMRPKLHARIARFEAALDAKARWPGKSWTEVAHEFGYHDQMHLVHDFAEFCSETPGSVLTELEMTYRAFVDAVRLGHQTEGTSSASRLFL